MDDILNEAERDRIIYTLAKQYLLSINKGVTSELIEEKISPPSKRMIKLSDLYLRLLESAQNAGMGPNVIGKAMGGLDKLGPIVCNFEPQAVIKKYGNDWKKVMSDITTTLKPKGKIRKKPRCLWPRFCRAIVSGAAFLAQFETADTFYSWADFFDKDDRARPSLPMLLAYEIDGIGFPLACDFLKEIGYVNFGKPDVHLKKIFTALKLCLRNDDYQVFKSIVRVARNCDVTPFAVDKLFWLIGSGNLVVNGIKIGRQREPFIRYVRAKS